MTDEWREWLENYILVSLKVLLTSKIFKYVTEVRVKSCAHVINVDNGKRQLSRNI